MEIQMEKKKEFVKHVVQKSIFNVRVILKCAILVHYVMGYSLEINCVFSCCSKGSVK